MKRKTQPSIQTKRLLIRPLTLKDGADIKRIAGRKEIAETTRYIPHPYPEGYAEAWINTLEGNYNNGLQMISGIEVRETGQLIGSIGFDFHEEDESASIGYWLDPDIWGQGYATEASKGMIAYGFKILGLNRINAYCLAHNKPSVRVLEKSGMLREGMARQVKKIRGKLSDLAYYGLLKSDFDAMQAKS